MCLIDNLARKQGVLLEQESKEAGLASPCNPQRSASSNKPQISEAGSHSKADKQAAVSQPKKHAVSLISKPKISRLGSHSKADKQAAVSQPQIHAVSLMSKLKISGAGSHSKADKQAAVSLPKKLAVSQISKPQRSRLVKKQGRFLIFRRRHPQSIRPRWFCHALSQLVALSVLYFD